MLCVCFVFPAFVTGVPQAILSQACPHSSCPHSASASTQIQAVRLAPRHRDTCPVDGLPVEVDPVALLETHQTATSSDASLSMDNPPLSPAGGGLPLQGDYADGR